MDHENVLLVIGLSKYNRVKFDEANVWQYVCLEVLSPKLRDELFMAMPFWAFGDEQFFRE